MNRITMFGGVTVLAAVFLFSPGFKALAQQRLPTIAPEQYTADQKKAAEEFLAARKVPVFGPFEPMMHSPEVMSMARSMGDYLRYHSAIGNSLSELVILVTAREWSAPCVLFAGAMLIAGPVL